MCFRATAGAVRRARATASARALDRANKRIDNLHIRFIIGSLNKPGVYQTTIIKFAKNKETVKKFIHS